jgi:hypothetical protein
MTYDDMSSIDQNTHRLWRMGTAPQPLIICRNPASACRQRLKDYVLKAKPPAVERGSQSLSNILLRSVFVSKDLMI